MIVPSIDLEMTTMREVEVKRKIIRFIDSMMRIKDTANQNTDTSQIIITINTVKKSFSQALYNMI